MDKERLLKAYAECGVIKQAAEKVDCSYTLARKTLIREGIVPVKLTAAALASVFRLYNAGKSIAVIANAVKKQHYEISFVLKQNTNRLNRPFGEKGYLPKDCIKSICEDYEQRVDPAEIQRRYKIGKDVYRRALALGKADKNTRLAYYRCKRCGKDKKETKFWSVRKTVCRRCDPSDPGCSSRTARNKLYLKKYGITIDDYERIEEQQSHKCAMCNQAQGTHKHRLAVDHDHATGEVRGLLCVNCNTFLGSIEKPGIDLARATGYLANPPAHKALAKLGQVQGCLF